MHRTEIYGNVRFTKDTWTIGAWIHFRKYAEKLIYMEIIAQKVPSPVNPYEYVICAEVRQFGVSAKTADSLYAFYVNNIYGTYGTECNISQ